MNILAIDPGTRESGFVFFDKYGIKSKGKIDNREVLNRLYGQPTTDFIVVIEMVASYGMPVGKDVFETVVWIGRFMEACISRGIQVRRVYRKDVTLHMCNSARAKDGNIRQAIIDRFGKPGTKKEPNDFYNDSIDKMSGDIWQAFAVGLTFFDGDEYKILTLNKNE